MRKTQRVTRRTFVKSTAVASAGLALSSTSRSTLGQVSNNWRLVANEDDVAEYVEILKQGSVFYNALTVERVSRHKDLSFNHFIWDGGTGAKIAWAYRFVHDCIPSYIPLICNFDCVAMTYAEAMLYLAPKVHAEIDALSITYYRSVSIEKAQAAKINAIALAMSDLKEIRDRGDAVSFDFDRSLEE